MSWPRQGSQNSLQKPKLMEDQQENKRKSWISWDWGRACQGKLGGCPPPNLFSAVCSLSFVPCAVLCCAVLVPLCCAFRVVCAVSGDWCCWFVVSLPVAGGLVVALAARRCRLVLCVGFGARVWSGRPSASSLWCLAPPCCVLWRCAAVWCCAVVPRLPLLFFPCWSRWFSVSPLKFPAKPVKMVFRF